MSDRHRPPRSWYEAKKLILRPWTRYKAARSDTTDRFGAAMLDLHYHRPAIYRFVRVHDADPDLLHRADLDPDSVVIDAGAHVGDWCSAMVERYGCTIHAFEPAPGALRKLRRRTRDDPQVHTHAVALGREDGTATMELAGPGSALGRVDGSFGTRQVEVRDVVAVLHELGLDEVDLLKVNIEGGEYDLFDRLIEAHALHRIRTVSVQFHEWLPHAHRRRWAIRRALRRTHRQLWCHPWVWEVWERR